MEKKRRIPIPESVQAEVMFKSDLLCCICRERGDHIHHVDGNPSNNKIENLVFLCFPHHDEMEIKGGLRKKLSSKALILFRNQLYKENEIKRQNALKEFDKPIAELSEEVLFRSSINAIIIIEFEKIKEEYFKANWKEKTELVGNLFKFAQYSNYKVKSEILRFLLTVASSTRSKMPREMSSMIESLVNEFYVSPSNENDYEENTKLSIIAINIGKYIAYDAGIYLGQLNILSDGLIIIKYVYSIGKENNITQISDYALNAYQELEHSFQRPSRDDLENALTLTRIYKNDIDTFGLMYPKMPDKLYNLIISDIHK